MGLPKFHGECRHKAMQAKRASITGGKYINGTELAKKLGIGRSTLKRWIEAGKLPKPRKGISGMMLFERAAVC
jgi:excisionase family DNA binding protein